MGNKLSALCPLETIYDGEDFESNFEAPERRPQDLLSSLRSRAHRNSKSPRHSSNSGIILNIIA